MRPERADFVATVVKRPGSSRAIAVAMRRARALVCQGYPTAFRFDLAVAERHPWTKRSRQNEALAGIAATPEYQAFLRDEVAYGAFPVKDAGANTLAAVRDGALEGRSRRRCWTSGALVAPDTPVVRLRPLVGHADDGAFEVADRTAFDASGWAQARRDFEADRVPVGALFAPTRLTRRPSHAPAIAAFEAEVARDSAAFDPARAFALVAEHAPPPIRRTWVTGPESRERAFAPLAGDVGHGDAVNLTWNLLKAGHGPDLFRWMAASPQANNVFVLLATFDRANCRAAAARHFALPDLDAAMDLAFSERPSLDNHVALAAFGRAHPRRQAGLVAAMRAHALSLYSNVRPGAGWFLDGLNWFGRERGCHLLFFLAHHPEDDPVLATMLERRWPPGSVGLGGYDAYVNARAFYYRAAMLPCMLDDPRGLDAWLTTPYIQRLCCGAKDRDTHRLVAAWRERSRRSRSDDGRKSTPSATVPHAE